MLCFCCLSFFPLLSSFLSLLSLSSWFWWSSFVRTSFRCSVVCSFPSLSLSSFTSVCFIHSFILFTRDSRLFHGLESTHKRERERTQRKIQGKKETRIRVYLCFFSHHAMMIIIIITHTHTHTIMMRWCANESSHHHHLMTLFRWFDRMMMVWWCDPIFTECSLDVEWRRSP